MKYLKLYESFSGKSELKEALEIYAEDLPFDVSDIIVDDRTNNITNRDKWSNFRISFTYLDDDIRNDIDCVERDGKANWMDEIDLQSDYRPACKELEYKIEQLVSPAFIKFAKKYDMKFSSLRVDIGDPYIIVFFTLTT